MARGRKTSDTGVALGIWFETACEWLVRGGLIIIGASLIYLLAYGVVSGQVFKVTATDMARVRGVVESVSSWLLYASVAVALIWGARHTERSEEQAGYVLIYGLVMWFGVPFLVRTVGEGKNPGGWQNEVVTVMLHNILLAGQGTLLTLLVPGLRVGWIRLVARAELKKSREYKAAAKLKRESPKSSGKPNAFSPCWKLPYCRDYLLNVCPAFKARRRCWKLKRGCFCDHSMLENLVTGVKSFSASAQASLKSEMDARNTVAQMRDKNPPCKRCFIYLEHEELKYSVLSPLMYPLVAGICYFGWEPLVKPAWSWTQHTLAGLWAKVAFSSAAADALGMNDVFGNAVISYLFAIILGFVVLLGLLRFVELWCFKWKL